MRFNLRLKNGQNYSYDQKQTEMISKNLNYMQLLQFVMSGQKIPKNATINLLGQNVYFNNIESVEFIFK